MDAVTRGGPESSMDSNQNPNPYAPPSLAVASDEVPIGVKPTKSVSYLLISLIYTLTAMYLFYTCDLLTKYSGLNWESGLLFLLNAPVLIFWTLVSYRNPDRIVSAGRLAVLAQAAILITMLIRKTNNPSIYVNVAIIILFLFATLLCSQWQQKKWPFQPNLVER